MTSASGTSSPVHEKRDPRLPEMVVWDIDRTLLDAGPATHTAFEAALRTVAPIKTVPSGQHMTGRTDPAVAREVLLENDVAPELADDLVREVIAALPEQFRLLRARFRDEGRVLPGVREVLHTLHAAGVWQTVLTGTIRANALLKLDLFGLAGLLDLAVAAFGDDAELREELPALVLERGERCGGRRLDRRRVWLVGDTPGDLSGARSAGVRCLLVATGLYAKGELARLGADGVLSDLTDHHRVLATFRGE